MTQEEKLLLLQDLCARLPYGVKLKAGCDVTTLIQIRVIEDKIDILTTTWCGETKVLYKENLDECKPYLRSISSMTEEEDKEWQYHKNAITESCDERLEERISELHDWFNAHHFDYRGLISKGLALEAPKYMYKFD